MLPQVCAFRIIAAIVASTNWKEVVFLCQQSTCGEYKDSWYTFMISLFEPIHVSNVKIVITL